MIDQGERETADAWRDPPPERLASAAARRLPDFVVIGTQRGGTTSLYRYLAGHPDVVAAWRKEVHYFDRYYSKGIDWYRAHFPLRDEEGVVGEASPSYLFHPAAPTRARATIPAAQIIVLLRNPVDRAYSHYQMKVRRGVETLPFAEAIEREPERLGDSEELAGTAWRHFSYVARGEYANQLDRWLGCFPREQLLVLKSEEFFQQPEQVLHETLAFLGLRPWSPRGFRPHHLSSYPRLDPATRRRLVDHFAPHNRRLYDLLGRDFGWDDE